MQKPLSNVSLHSYQDYQPTRKYGPQHEPGGYAAAVQQRTNMTQREDALKFEQGRIKALQEERLHIQKKTFTKWMNSFLQKARMEVEDLFLDLGDGRRLLKLLEIISGERLPRPNTGRMRVHKIENVNKSLSFLHTKVRLESIGAEDIVDGNPRLILGLIWTIILRFQIQEIEIDVDEENESSEKKSAKDALLLWCQRKTSGYHGVNIHNFSDSWRSGLGFNALIHSHRPDLFRWQEVPTTDHVATLNHAFDVAHANLGIPKLLDAEDVDTTRPDEKSVMTYVASYYHTFARMKNEQKSGRRIANIIGQLMDIDARKAEYIRLMSALLEWILAMIRQLNERELPNSLDAIQRLLLAFKQYRTVEKPPKYKERSEIEALFFDINTQHKSLLGDAWSPEGHLPQDLERAWQQLEQAEHAREIALRTELLRQQRLEQLNYKFNTKSVLRKGYLKEMIQVLSDPRYGSNLAQVDATVKKHEAISADILARKERFEDLSAMSAELVREKYHDAEAVSRTCADVLDRWSRLLLLLERHRASLAHLAALMALLRECEARRYTTQQMKSQFQSEEAGRHLSDVERLLQAHALQELQLGALDDAIRRLVRQGNAVEGPAQPKQQLAQQLTHLEDEYDSLVAAAKDRKARLEDARNLYQFLEDHDEEEGWVTDKQRICRADVAAKDLRGVTALRQKHTALLHELQAREHVSQRHRSKGQSLIDAKHPKSAEISRRLDSLSTQWDVLRELAAAREKQLVEAAEIYQFYGDANSALSWMKEKRPLVASADCGSDAHSAHALLARHRGTEEAVRAYTAEVRALAQHADRLRATGIDSLQLPTEVEGSASPPESEWVSETRLVPTEVWEEEPVERLEHRTVTEERSVPQVKALYAFTGQGISMSKGEVMFLMSKTNPDWWSVRKSDRSDGFVPANYVREIEPRIVPVQVRRAEKVRTVQRVKKTVLVKQVVPVRRSGAPAAPAPSRRPSAASSRSAGGPHVADTMQEIRDTYDELLTLSAQRRLQLEDAIQLFSLFAECDDLERWIRDKEKMLRDDDLDSVHAAKRKYEKFVTDLSAASRRLERIESSTQALIESRHGQASRARARHLQLRNSWDRLLQLKILREKSLEGASSVELFGRTCDEALDWMSEKESQLSPVPAGPAGPASPAGPAGPPSDLRTVQALQRRHAQLEREMEPLREKVNTVDLLADDVKSQYPSERANVESRQAQIRLAWARCEEQAQARRQRLESAVGHQIFGNSCAALLGWLAKTRAQLSQQVLAKDVATAEELHKEHQELRDDINTHADEFEEVIGLGKQLVANNPTLSDVADKVTQLEDERAAVEREWRDKDVRLKQTVQLASWNRAADQIEAATTAHQAYLDNTDTGSTLDEVLALLKRHEELESRLSAQEESTLSFAAKATALKEAGHFATEHITGRCKQVLDRRSAVKQAASERRRALQASLAHQQFLASAEELEAWIEDKTRTAKDQSYRDLANLERKLQKHEAFERELQSNEKQLRNVESVGASLVSSDPARAGAVSAVSGRLAGAWGALLAASRDKGKRLRQARAQRAHKRDVDDVTARLAELQRALASDETGTDLRSCKRLLNKHQALEQELQSLQQKARTLAAAGQDLASSGHFDATTIQQQSDTLLAAAAALLEPAAGRRRRLETSLQFHKFASEVSSELDWVQERAPPAPPAAPPAAPRAAPPADLLSAQTAVKKHDKLMAELAGRKPIIDRIQRQADDMVEGGHVDSDKIKEVTEGLSRTYARTCAGAQAHRTVLESQLRACQFLHEAGEVDAWLTDRAHVLTHEDLGRDRDRATALLTRHKAVELELDTYAAIIAEMGRSVETSQAGEAGALRERHARLAESLARLQRLAAERQKALVGSVLRHEYLSESAELEEWIQEQYVAASSDDYGQDYEHLLLLRSKFEELRQRVESGAERFSQCEELAHKLLTQQQPHLQLIEQRQEELGSAWQRLVEQLGSRGGRLHAAGEIHRFHRDVAELLSRAQDRTDAPILNTDLLAIDAQMQVLQEEGTRLIKLYPGGNVQQIEMQQKAMEEAWTGLKAAAEQRREDERRATQLQQFLTQVRDLTSWSSGLRASMSVSARGAVRDASAAQAMRAEHDAVKAEIEARDDSFRQALQMADEMVQAGHPAAQEVEEKSSAVLSERTRLHGAWAARQVSLDQLIDLHCFLRDAAQLTDLCAAQDAALNTEISPTLSVEEVQNLLKKHEAFEKLLLTQDEKLATLNSHGDKLLQQNHVESQRIADELRNVNERRKKVHALSRVRRERLSRARAGAQFSRDAGEAATWLAGKLHTLRTEQGLGEVTSLEDKIKKLQKHQAFRAELAANEPRIREVEALALQLQSQDGSDESSATAADADRVMRKLHEDWNRLLQATEERGRGLEEAQDMLEFNNQLEKIEAWIRDKEMMVQAHELGRDYEHCSALLRKLDGLDTDMQVDDHRVRQLCQLADKLLKQGPTQQAASVSSRRDTLLDKWRALTGALQNYRDKLTGALEIHAFNRDVAETMERIGEKCLLFGRSTRGSSLSAADELTRRHHALLSEAQAVRGKIAALAGDKDRLATSYPERAAEIELSMKSLQEAWDKLEELAAKRTALLDEALAEHKFDESLKELEAWVSESVKRMRSAEEVDSVELAETALLLHHEIKAEIDGRQKMIASLQSAAAPDKKEKLQALSDALSDAWLQREQALTQAQQLQQFKEQARQTEEWLAGMEAFLNNDDLGENQDAVEKLIRKHQEFSKLLESQSGKLSELQQTGETLLRAGHSHAEYIETRMKHIAIRGDKLKEWCTQRGVKLSQSRQLIEFTRELSHQTDWISLKLQQANDHNYRELSNLQSKIQKHSAFESEIAANKGRIDELANQGEELIEANHYASQEIARHIQNLDNQWQELQSATKSRRSRLQEAYQARVYLRGVDDCTSWLDDVEAQLMSEDHGTDLQSVSVLVKRHTRLAQQVSRKADTVTQLVDTANQLAEERHFMADELLAKANSARDRYRQLSEPMQIRRDNLQDAEQLYRWQRDAAEEMAWLEERSAAASSEDYGSTLAQSQAMLKKHLVLEAELAARESSVGSVTSRAQQLLRGGHFARDTLQHDAYRPRDMLRDMRAAAARREARLRAIVHARQLVEEISEVESWLRVRIASLSSTECGRDELSVRTLQTRMSAVCSELAGFETTLDKLEKAAKSGPGLGDHEESPIPETAEVSRKLSELRTMYEETKLLSAQREQRLLQSLKYFKFVCECEETTEWIGEQMSVAASEEYGLDVEHVDTLQQHFDNFQAHLHANEGRIEAVCEAGALLLEENTPEAERVRRRIEDVQGLWDDLNELAAARQEALCGARQVHEFDRIAEETASRVAERAAERAACTASGVALQERRRALRALCAHMDAIRTQHRMLHHQADKLSAAYPDAAAHVQCKLEEVSDAVDSLAQLTAQSQHQLTLAEQLQQYFDTYQDLLAWCNETLARVTAPELARDVTSAERLVARHQDIRTEIDAKLDAFTNLYTDGEKLVSEGHFMSEEISERMRTLRARWSLLQDSWTQRDQLYRRHLDALCFQRDADALDTWISTRVPQVRDGKLGSSVSQVEELINRHRDLEETIDAQRARFDALHRQTLVEQQFAQQQAAEAEARAQSEQQREQQRAELWRRREVERLTEERRVGAEQHQTELTVGVSEESLSPAPQFDKLPKPEAGVKRAESMQVSTKTAKRTPSFTTRRRTQSFRRHRVADLPPVEIEGVLERKHESGSGGARATVRSWRSYYSVLCGQLLCFFRDHQDFQQAKAAAPPQAIANARCTVASDYTKRAHVFRVSCSDGAEFLFACSSRALMQEWVAKIAFHAALQPRHQLTPYSDADSTPPTAPTTPPTAEPDSPTAELRRRLHQNASSSSSSSGSPVSGRARSQADILREHRDQQAAANQPERLIQSSVLPSLPPRQPDTDEASDVVMRNVDQPAPAWGRSRFSNGRDINSEFISSQQQASESAPPLPASGPPAVPERAPNIPERGPKVPERAPSVPEKQSVTALVNRYQQRATWDQRHSSHYNNNYSVDSSSHYYAPDVAYGAGAGPGTGAGAGAGAGGNQRPASVSGGSPALDQRPASRSSGESEVSLSGNTKDKKDKKGVFGGLFSRKKRPQSHM